MAEAFSVDVTREVLQEIAEHGAYQLPKDLIPPIDEFFKGLASPAAKSGEFGVQDALSVYRMWRYLERIIELESNGTMVIKSANAEGCEERSKISNPVMHRDIYGQALSFVWMPESTDDQLGVYGRGETPTPYPVAKYSYKNGPVLMAGNNFGKQFVNEGVPVGPTWHFGSGTSVGMPFFAVDVYTTHTSPALRQHRSSALVDLSH